MSGVSGSQVVLGGVVQEGWWLVVDGESGPARIVDGPYPDRGEADLAAALRDRDAEPLRPLFGVRRPDGTLKRRPSPQDWAWLGHLGEQLERLDWDDSVDEEDPVTTLVVELTAALAEAGLPVHDPAGELGGACLVPETAAGGVVVTWRLHDRMCVEQVHGAETDTVVQHVMNGAVADVLRARGFAVEAFGDSMGHLVRAAA